MGFKFKEVFVFIDIDDIYQEATQYKLVNNELIYNNLNDLQKNSSYIKSTKKNISFRKTLKIRFPLSYQILYQIKYYKVPKPVHRFHYKNQIAAWTYTNNITFNYDVNLGIKNSILALDKLYKLLKKNNIKLAIAIYPYPNQLLYDSLNSKQIKIWKKFCISRCSNFLNFFPVLFNNQNILDYDLAIKIKIIIF